MLSRRYRLESLETLAKDRIIAQMTPENRMPILWVPDWLSSYLWDVIEDLKAGSRFITTTLSMSQSWTMK